MVGFPTKIVHIWRVENIQQRVLEILERAQANDKLSQYTDIGLSILILLNVAAVTLESVAEIGARFMYEFYIFEIFSLTIFSIEYILRIWVNGINQGSKYKTPLGRRLQYIFSFNGIIDFLAIVPSLLAYIIPAIDLRWVRVVRLLRLLKLSNYSSAVEDLFSAIRDESRSFAATLYLFLIALFLASAMMYLAENQAQPDKFSSIPETLWWALITLTTVGYGDVSPITPLGKIIGAFTALMGVCSVALFTGIIANSFANQINKRKTIFESEIKHALLDGHIDADEKRKIEALRQQFNLPEEYARAIIAGLESEDKTL